MGLWSFVKDAGASVFGGKAAEEARPDAPVPQEEALKREVEKLGLDTAGLDLKVEGAKVTVKGKAASPEVKEKMILAVGNVQGIEAVETDEDDEVAPVFYTVKKGDTLSSIAKTTLGNAAHYPKVFEANRPMLSHPDKIYPGQVLRIPQN